MDFKCLIVMVAYASNSGNHWLKAWRNGYKYQSELVVVHNAPRLRSTHEILKYQPDYYIKRQNIGFDLGVFQDIVLETIDVPKWDWLLQFTYDTVPMCRNWLDFYYDKIGPNIGLIAGKPSYGHVRTTGFMISRQAADKITFPAYPMVSKNDCWELEHRNHNLMNQILKNGFDVISVNPPNPGKTQHIIWDYNTEGDRWAKYNQQFAKEKYQKQHKLI